MPRARLKVKSNEGLVSLSNAYPETRFKVLGAWPKEENLRLLIETAEIEPNTLEEALVAASAITDFEIRHSHSRMILFEVSTPSPEPHGAMADSGIVPSFPLLVEGGWLIGDIIATRNQLSSFREELLSGEIDHEIVQISGTDEKSDLLTERQQDVLELAVERGYYDTPRGCSLTELATVLDVSKSVVSRVLHRAEGRIVRAYCTSSADSDKLQREYDA